MSAVTLRSILTQTEHLLMVKRHNNYFITS